MTLDQWINLVVTVSLVELMVAIGLAVPLSEVAAVATNPRLVLMAMVANYVAVPAVAVALLLLVQADPLVAAGILIAAVCPGAPYALVQTIAVALIALAWGRLRPATPA